MCLPHPYTRHTSYMPDSRIVCALATDLKPDAEGIPTPFVKPSVNVGNNFHLVSLIRLGVGEGQDEHEDEEEKTYLSLYCNDFRQGLCTPCGSAQHQRSVVCYPELHRFVCRKQIPARFTHVLTPSRTRRW